MPAFPTFRDPQALLSRLGGTDALIRMAEAGVVVLLALQCARLGWLLLPPAPLGSIPGAATDTMAPRPDRLAIDAFHPGAAPGATADTSGLRLYATRGGAAGGSAIVADRAGTQRSYAVGDEIAPGAVLAAVHADHAILESSGRRTELRFPVAIPANRPPAAAKPIATQTPAARTATGADAASPTIDPTQLLAEAGLRSIDAGGGEAGYTVIPRGDGAVLRQAGLQAGDVLLSVNGQALTPERYAELGDSLAGAATITLTYRRDGQVRTATLQAPTP
ncbi:type II secretion system protein N [Luteimonas kalidii]|uniref:Type II secretion system protein N n=1 Tax=Luteimonas kalidii TaxID=3042025 RepID=A0ABT6JQ98_9GAMM|nr:type II secretion system protein N [Luteimonas kalidii]MDH5832864.1 type II secretion system protein N [Luteimonas kalidii]